MYNNFTEEARQILMSAKNEMKELKHPYVGSEHLLLAILKSKDKIVLKLKEYGLSYDVFKNELNKNNVIKKVNDLLMCVRVRFTRNKENVSQET